ncbi:hypothetical protein V2J09_002806 [Rumex salicifolius]
MSWGLGWKRPTEIFTLTLQYGNSEISPASVNPEQIREADGDRPDKDGPKTIELGWTTGDDEDKIALRLQSQLMVGMPSPHDTVVVELSGSSEEKGGAGDVNVGVQMKVVKRREPLRAVKMAKAMGSGQAGEGVGVLTKLLRSSFSPTARAAAAVAGAATVTTDAGGFGGGDGLTSFADHWKSVTELNLNGCGISVLPVEVTQLPLLEKLYLDNNRLSLLPPELGDLKDLKVLCADNNMLASVPVELRQCVGLVELSLENNKLIRPLLDVRAMSELRILRLFGNPLEFLPEIVPLHKLRHLSLANIRIVADEHLRSVTVKIEAETGSYFGASKQHNLSAFFSLIFRFSSCHHPLLASSLAKIMEDPAQRGFVSKDENAVRQLISMISTDDRHVVEQACIALSSLAADVSGVMMLMKCDIMKPVETVLQDMSEEVISVLQVVVNLALASDSVARKMLSKDLLRSLKILCAHKNPEVQRLALLSIGNLAFCVENRQTLVTSESLRELLMRFTSTPEPRVNKAAARALAILGENEILRRAIRARPVARQGLRILSMDGGGMKGLATVKILKEIEKGTGKRIHEMFDLICGTSTGGMLAVALGVKSMTLDQCEETYKKLGKLVFAEPPKENEVATWREKLDHLYKSSSQSFRIAVHGAKHSAEQFETLLKEMCSDEDGDLLIDSAVKGIPKVFVISTLVSVMPAQPFVFRNYQYPAGTPEMYLSYSDNSAVSMTGADNTRAQVGYQRNAFIGSCKHNIWQAIRASSAAPYYLDDFSDGVNRWQDGAIVANNPTIFAIREAQLLWPDTKIDCVVSVACGSVPIKARKAGWVIWDTVPVLIESACSVERVEEALSTLIPMLPDIQYFRFNPVDDRCDMELDETDPTGWLRLETATEEYINNSSEAFRAVCERLTLPYQHDEKWTEFSSSESVSKSLVENDDDKLPSLGWRRSVILVEATHSVDSGRATHHVRSLEAFCKHSGIKLSCVNAIPGSSKMGPPTTLTSPFASPIFTGSFPSSPLLYSPEIGHQNVGRIDMVPPLSLDGQQSGKLVSSSQESPSGPRKLSPALQALFVKIQNSTKVGIVHLALQNDTVGAILSWQNDVFVVAEPGDLADKFLRSVKFSLLPMMRGLPKKELSKLINISTIAELVSYRPCFQIGCIVHRFIGRQTQVMEDDHEIGAYMFRRTVPSVHLTAEDVRLMVGAWRDRIVIFTGRYGPNKNLTKAFLDLGAKALICPSNEAPEMHLSTFHGSGDFGDLENGKFEIGFDEAEEEDMEADTLSDWEDIEYEKIADNPKVLWEIEEDELSRFACQLYESLFRDSATVDAALQSAMASTNRKLKFSLHLPNMT